MKINKTPRKLGQSTKVQARSQNRRKLGDSEQSVLKRFKLDSEEDYSGASLGEIKEARVASRKAIDMLMADLRRHKKVNTWVPGGGAAKQGKVFHANAQELLTAK